MQYDDIKRGQTFDPIADALALKGASGAAEEEKKELSMSEMLR